MSNKIDRFPTFDAPETGGLYDVHFPKFAFWAQKIQPLVYDDSLSFYEVLCKLTQKVNELIKQVNELTEAQKKFVETVTALLNQIISEWNKMVDYWNSMVDTWESWEQTFANWSSTFDNWTTTFERWRVDFNKYIGDINNALTELEQFEENITNEWNTYKSEVNETINNFKEEVNNSITNLDNRITNIDNRVTVIEDGGSQVIPVIPETAYKTGTFTAIYGSLSISGTLKILNMGTYNVVCGYARQECTTEQWKNSDLTEIALQFPSDVTPPPVGASAGNETCGVYSASVQSRNIGAPLYVSANNASAHTATLQGNLSVIHHDKEFISLGINISYFA